MCEATVITLSAECWNWFEACDSPSVRTGIQGRIFFGMKTQSVSHLIYKLYIKYCPALQSISFNVTLLFSLQAVKAFLSWSVWWIMSSGKASHYNHFSGGASSTSSISSCSSDINNTVLIFITFLAGPGVEWLYLQHYKKHTLTSCTIASLHPRNKNKTFPAIWNFYLVEQTQTRKSSQLSLNRDTLKTTKMTNLHGGIIFFLQCTYWHLSFNTEISYKLPPVIL